MTPQDFSAWLVAMKTAGLARSDAECGRLLDRTPRHILHLKRNGADKVTALACSALIHQLEPWEDKEAGR